MAAAWFAVLIALALLWSRPLLPAFRSIFLRSMASWSTMAISLFLLVLLGNLQ